jgi:hypothetical protein
VDCAAYCGRTNVLEYLIDVAKQADGNGRQSILERLSLQAKDGKKTNGYDTDAVLKYLSSIQ